MKCLSPVQPEGTSLRSWQAAGSRQSQGGPAGIHHPRLIYHSADPPQLLVMEPLRGKAGAGGSFIKQETLTN